MGAPVPSLEAGLLLERVCAARAAPDIAPPADLEEVDWLAVAQLAEREKLLGVLWPALAQEHEQIPELIAAAMRRQAMVSEFRMRALETRLAAVVRLLDDHGIPAMLLKGSALAVTRYGSFARRPMGDLDLLVHQAQADAAWGLLRDAGWTPEQQGVDDFYAVHQHLCPLVAPGGASVVVELHRSIFHTQGPIRLDEADLWEAARPVSVGGRRAWVPAPEHMALHLCVHFAWSHELRSGLARTIRDFGALAPALDWGRLVAAARAAHAESSCYWTLRLAAELGGVPVPASVIDVLAPRLPRWARRAVERIIVAQALDPRREFVPSLRLSRLAWTLAIAPGSAGYGPTRPWTSGAEFDRLTNAAPPASLARRLGGQVSALPHWAQFVLVAAGVDRQSRGRREPTVR